MSERLVWDKRSVHPTGALSVGFDLDLSDLTADQLEALRTMRAAFFLFDRDRATPRRE